MQKKFYILNFSLIAAVLFSILFQSVHSIEHIVEEFTSEKCDHRYDTGDSQITHQHHNFDDCFACDFTFSSFISPELCTPKVTVAYKAIPYFFTTPDSALAFSGSSYLLRGPPVFIV